MRNTPLDYSLGKDGLDIEILMDGGARKEHAHPYGPGLADQLVYQSTFAATTTSAQKEKAAASAIRLVQGVAQER